MPTLKQAFQDKRVINAVRAFPPGEFGSEDFTIQVRKFIDVTLEFDEAREVIKRHSLTKEELAFLYSMLVRVLMPNPYIKAGANMLAASLPFYEPFRLEAILSAIEADLRNRNESEAERREVITEHATIGANAAWQSHTAARGAAKIPPPITGSGGCGSILIIALLPLGRLIAELF